MSETHDATSPSDDADVDAAKNLLMAGEDLRRAQRFSEAIENFNAVIDFPLENGPVRNLLLVHAFTCRGAAFAERDKLNDAIDDFSRAIQIDPEYSLAYFNRAMAWEKKGQLDQAIDDYVRLIRFDPEFSDAKLRLAQTRSRHDGNSVE